MLNAEEILSQLTPDTGYTYYIFFSTGDTAEYWQSNQSLNIMTHYSDSTKNKYVQFPCKYRPTTDPSFRRFIYQDNVWVDEGDVTTAINRTEQGAGVDAQTWLDSLDWLYHNTDIIVYNNKSSGDISTVATLDAVGISPNECVCQKLDLKLVSYSSQYSTSYPASNAFDGSTSSYWRTVASPSYPQSIVVELDSIYRLLRFRLYPGTSSYRPASFKLLGSYDGELFDEIYSGTCSSLADFVEFELPNESQYKYAKIEFTGASTSRLYVYEFELYGMSTLSKFLLRENSVLYTVIDGVLTPIETSSLSSEIFREFGLDAIPDWVNFSSLVNPEILHWVDTPYVNPAFNVSMIATPPRQIVITDAISFAHETIKGIEAVIVDCDGDLTAAVSFDNKVSWKAWNGTEWVNLDSQFSGMSKETLEAITVDQWVQLYEGATEMFIRLSFTNTEQVVRQIYVDFLN